MWGCPSPLVLASHPLPLPLPPTLSTTPHTRVTVAAATTAATARRRGHAAATAPPAVAASQAAMAEDVDAWRPPGPRREPANTSVSGGGARSCHTNTTPVDGSSRYERKRRMALVVSSARPKGDCRHEVEEEEGCNGAVFCC